MGLPETSMNRQLISGEVVACPMLSTYEILDVA
jgi:hypothetical protein